MNKGKVLFIDTAHPILTELLTQSGYKCDFFQDYQRADFEKIISAYQGVIIRSKIKLDRDFLSKATQLRFIGRVGAGMENIDVQAAAELGIICLNAPEGNRDAVAEQAVGMLLSLFNRILIADREVRGGLWLREQNRGVELGGKTIGIVGMGNTGSAFAKKLQGFDVEVLAYDKYKSGFGNADVTEVNLDDIYNRADIISYHVPLTDETNYMFDSQVIDRFVKPFYLVNTSRGKVVHTGHLLQGLKSGKILGASLDVLEYEGLSFEAIQESPDFSLLARQKNVVLTPHIAGWTHESNEKMAKILFAKIQQLAV